MVEIYNSIEKAAVAELPKVEFVPYLYYKNLEKIVKGICYQNAKDKIKKEKE